MTKKIILVVDYIEDNRLLLNMIIKRIDSNFIAINCVDGDDAVKVATELYDQGKDIYAILIDFMMPKLNGEQALVKICKHLKDTKHSSLKSETNRIAIVTADYEFIDSDMCDNCFHEIFYKPIDIKRITEFLT